MAEGDDKGMMEGTTDTTFAPAMNLTRSRIAQVLYNLEERPEAPGAAGFPDVAAGAWYADAVNYVVSTGVMSGDDTQHLFQPEYGVERSQFAVIVYRFAGGTPTEEDAEFSDLADDEWYYEYVKWMVGKGLMGGNGGAFDPSGFLSCEQAIIVLYRLAGEPTVSGTLDDYPYAPKVSESGRDAVTWAWNNGLITEKECVWYPTQAVSRAQVALLLMRYDALIGRNAA